MLKIYHNPRCKKSRAGLEALKASGKEYEIVEYLKEPLSFEEMEALIAKTGFKPMELMRTQEIIYKGNIKGKSFSDKALIEFLSKEPKLLKRPLVEDGQKAVLADPPENLIKII